MNKKVVLGEYRSTVYLFHELWISLRGIFIPHSCRFPFRVADVDDDLDFGNIDDDEHLELDDDGGEDDGEWSFMV